jgi:hypothetical protein
MFDEITASSPPVKTGPGLANKLSDPPFPVNPAGFNIHSCEFTHRPKKTGCVLHTHTCAACQRTEMAFI